MEREHVEVIGGPTEAEDIEQVEKQRKEADKRDPDALDGDETLPGEAID